MFVISVFYETAIWKQMCKPLRKLLAAGCRNISTATETGTPTFRMSASGIKIVACDLRFLARKFF
jgi:hypothetical protein